MWLSNYQAKKFFYIARDHSEHGIAIPGGLWGAATKYARYELYNIFKPMLIPSTHQVQIKDSDQLFLQSYVWDAVKNNSVIFDSYFCQQLGGRPYLSQRPVGNCFLGCIRPCCANDEKQMLKTTIRTLSN